MGQRGASDGWDPLADPPSLLEVTVESAPRRSGLRLRAGGVPRGLGVLCLAGAVAGVCAVLIAGGAGGARHRSVTTVSASAGAEGIAVHMRGVGQLVTSTEAYRFPLGCMSMTMTPKAMAHVLHTRTGPCWRYGVFVTAILHRVNGAWRLALEATSPTCPRLPLPAAVRAQLAVCQR